MGIGQPWRQCASSRFEGGERDNPRAQEVCIPKPAQDSREEVEACDFERVETDKRLGIVGGVLGHPGRTNPQYTHSSALLTWKSLADQSFTRTTPNILDSASAKGIGSPMSLLGPPKT
eukprot:scaffold296154_cov30-Tisochrysis_lutea.AAC.2